MATPWLLFKSKVNVWAPQPSRLGLPRPLSDRSLGLSPGLCPGPAASVAPALAIWAQINPHPKMFFAFLILSPPLFFLFSETSGFTELVAAASPTVSGVNIPRQTGLRPLKPRAPQPLRAPRLNPCHPEAGSPGTATARLTPGDFVEVHRWDTPRAGALRAR